MILPLLHLFSCNSVIVKLEKMGVRGKMLAVIKEFLEDRAIKLKVNKFKGIRRMD